MRIRTPRRHTSREAPVGKGHYAFIDALRGYAILGVMVVHGGSVAVSWQPSILHTLVDEGGMGVQLFFVASALTLAMSWENRKDGVIPFYTRRFFRIAPLFWLGILFFTWLDGMGPRYFAPQGISATDIALTVTFLNGWHPLTLTSVVPGGWSIVVEMSFYLIFPLLMLFIRNVRTAIIGFVLSAAVSLVIMAILWPQRASLWPGISDELVATLLSLWLPSQLPVFMIGFITYFAIRDLGQRYSSRSLTVALVMAIGTMMALPFMLNAVTFRGRDPLSSLLYGLCFGVFAFCLSRGRGVWLVNPLIRFLGKISFSAYLVHFAVLHSEIGLAQLRASFGSGVGLFAVYLPYLIAVTALISWGTYCLIERPMIGVGSTLIRRLALSGAVVTN